MSKLLGYIPRIWKAIAAGVGAGSASYAGQIDGGVTKEEWVAVIGAALITGLITWFAPYKAAEA